MSLSTWKIILNYIFLKTLPVISVQLISAFLSGYHCDWPWPLHVTCTLKALLCTFSKQPKRGDIPRIFSAKINSERKTDDRWGEPACVHEHEAAVNLQNTSSLKNWENNILPPDYNHIILWEKGTEQSKMSAPLNAPVWRSVCETFALRFYLIFK